MSFRIIAAFVIFLFGMRVNAQTVMPSEPLSKALTIFELPPFERAVCCIKYYEGLHRKKDYPYVGYGHRLTRRKVFIRDDCHRIRVTSP